MELRSSENIFSTAGALQHRELVWRGGLQRNGNLTISNSMQYIYWIKRSSFQIHLSQHSWILGFFKTTNSPQLFPVLWTVTSMTWSVFLLSSYPSFPPHAHTLLSLLPTRSTKEGTKYFLMLLPSSSLQVLWQFSSIPVVYASIRLYHTPTAYALFC